MKLYKLDTVYEDYEYLHNTFGYTESASSELSFKAIEPWGDSSGSGYGVNVSSFSECEYFKTGVLNWHGLNDLAWNIGVFPGTASTSVLVRNGILTNVASLVLDGQEYLLLEKDLEPGWMTPETAETRGWAVPSYIVVNETTGTVVHGGYSALEYGHISPVALEAQEMAYGVIRPCVIELPEMVYGSGEVVPPFETYYFLSSKVSTYIRAGASYQIYNGSGGVVLYDSRKTYTVVDSNPSGISGSILGNYQGYALFTSSVSGNYISIDVSAI